MTAKAMEGMVEEIADNVKVPAHSQKRSARRAVRTCMRQDLNMSNIVISASAA